jgi:hypothetical protein
MIRISPSHGGNTGSNPVGDTNYSNMLLLSAEIGVRLVSRYLSGYRYNRWSTVEIGLSGAAVQSARRGLSSPEQPELPLASD